MSLRYTKEQQERAVRISELTALLSRTASEFLSAHEMSYHELLEVYLRLMNSTNGYALKHELETDETR